MSKQNESPIDKLTEAYETMAERLAAAWEHAENGIHDLNEALRHAREQAVELDELTHEEAEEISSYLKRDLQDAGYYLKDSGRQLTDWLYMDLELIEDRMLELFSRAADKTRLELMQLEQRARRTEEYHTGEITSPGTLSCDQCGEVLHFQHTGHIPPCPKCKATRFTRKSR